MRFALSPVFRTRTLAQLKTSRIMNMSTHFSLLLCVSIPCVPATIFQGTNVRMSANFVNKMSDRCLRMRL